MKEQLDENENLFLQGDYNGLQGRILKRDKKVK